jgi:uncharacterized protein
MQTTLKVRVILNAHRNELAAISQDDVRLKVQAPAQDGKANLAVIRMLAQVIHCHKSSITIKRGARARHKIVEIAGLSSEEVWRRLQAEYHGSPQRKT